MKEWSQPCHNKLTASIFLDTNILSYLLDQSYPALTSLVTFFSQKCCVKLVSSDFCQLELVGIRKREHYLRAVIEKANANNVLVNCSSLLKYHNQYNCVEIDFQQVLPTIRQKVDEDLNKIVSNYGVKFDNIFHEYLFAPARDICLLSKISKEDSFVIASALNPQPNLYEHICFIITHDGDFVKWHKEVEDILKTTVYDYYNLSYPVLIDQRQAFGCNLDKGEFDTDRILKNFYKEYISKNSEYYIGTTLVPTGDNMPHNMIALKTKVGVTIRQQQYITIISKDFDFCITTSNRVTFYHRNSQVEENSIMEKANIVTCLFENINEELPEETYKEILSELQKKDHIVFYHPDSW